MNQQQSQLIQIAHSLLGTPYKYAAKPEEIPKVIDCSSFTQYVFKQIDIGLKRSTILQATQGKEIMNSNEIQAGDLIFFRGSKGHYDDELFPGRQIYIGHVAIYAGDNKAIHAASGKGVVEEKLEDIIKERSKIVMIKRFL